MGRMSPVSWVYIPLVGFVVIVINLQINYDIHLFANVDDKYSLFITLITI